MRQEQQPKRQDKIDLRVHACLYFIRPTGHTLRPLDIEVMKRLGSRVNLIPVIAKADTLGPSDLALFKERIRKVIAAQGIKVFTPPIDEDDRQAADHARELTNAMPFAVIGSDKDVVHPDGRLVKGRQYLWGIAEVENEDHCDFKKLRSLLIRTHMLDLIQTTEDQHYEGNPGLWIGSLILAYRASQMETRKFGEPKTRKLDNPKFKEEEESLRKRFTEQVKLEESRFRQWEQRVQTSIYGANLSSSLNEIVLTRTWRLRTQPSNNSKASWNLWLGRRSSVENLEFKPIANLIVSGPYINSGLRRRFEELFSLNFIFILQHM